MAYLPASITCKISKKKEIHHFDLVDPSDLVMKKCRCKRRLQGFPTSGTESTVTITYNIPRVKNTTNTERMSFGKSNRGTTPKTH